MASAVQTGSGADVQGTTGGGHQRVGRKRSPAQSNKRAEPKARSTIDMPGIDTGCHE
jgi:hypothetical protein